MTTSKDHWNKPMPEPHEVFQEAQERLEHANGGGGHEGNDRLLPIVAAILAVLTALASLFAHHKSIASLALKTDATLAQSQSSDKYSYYESKRIKYHIYTALAQIAPTPEKERELKKVADREAAAAEPISKEAERLAKQSEQHSEESENVLKQYETLELSATLFEISIVFVSISALAKARWLLWVGCGLAAVGLWFFATGMLAH